MNTPTVDIIIPAYKPDIKFEKLIRGLKRQSYPIQNIFIIHTKKRIGIPANPLYLQNAPASKFVFAPAPDALCAGVQPPPQRQ